MADRHLGGIERSTHKHEDFGKTNYRKVAQVVLRGHNSRSYGLVGSGDEEPRGVSGAMRGLFSAAVVAVALAIVGCGSTTTTTSTTSAASSGAVTVTVTSPTSGTVIAADHVTVRGTVSPTDAVVQIQGQPAAVGNGVFTGTATLHGGKTTIDVVGSSSGATPGSTSITVTRQSTGTPHHSSKGTTNVSSASAATPSVAAERGGPSVSSGETSCGGGLSVGPDTTCEFAEAVESSYRDSGGSSTVEAYSAVTNKTYEMTCVRGTTVECTGGIGASVFFAP